MSELRTKFEQAARSQQWNDAADFLNGLSMPEMLAALSSLGNKADVIKQTSAIMTARGWTGSAQRILFAGEVVTNLKIPAVKPADLPADQVADAQKFLQNRPPSTASAARAAVAAAIASGLITGDGARQLTEFFKTGFVTSPKTGNTVVISDLVVKLIDGLVQGRFPLNILNIARPNDPPNSPHGRPNADGQRISTACDIAAYNGAKIQLLPDGLNVDNTIKGVSDVLASLPPAVYKFGFTRPTNGIGGPVFPDLDVFLPAPDKLAVDHQPPGTNGAAAITKIVNDGAKSLVTAAINGNPKARYNSMFPDGHDHAHVEVLSMP